MTPIEQHNCILLVTESEQAAAGLASALGPRLRTLAATNIDTALDRARNSIPDLVLLDTAAADASGIEICRRLKSLPETASLPIVLMLAEMDEVDPTLALKEGVCDIIRQPISPPLLRARMNLHLELGVSRGRAWELSGHIQTLHQTTEALSLLAGRVAEFRDGEDTGHALRIAHFSRQLAQAAGMSSEEAELLYQAAPLHDLGKVGIPEHILKKPGGLDDAEWIIVKRHPVIGAALIGEHDPPVLKMAREVALTHHEKWNGEGYPQRLKGEEIPLAGRVVAIADVFDALTTHRPYKDAWSVERAVALIRSESGRLFDPNLVDAFLGIMSAILQVRAQYANANGFG